ncbi:BamA/TamA family outer membrane protein [Candidatus Acetothermia bacterium]|nr:BamA/TamA family outer membrane protein [Candidatus Acetothermia bacterium]
MKMLRLTGLVVFIVIGFSALVLAQGEPNKWTVREITIKGAKNVRVSEIKAALPFKVGVAVVENDIIKGKDAIERMGLFKSADYTKKVDGSDVRITYTVVENPVVKRISISGNQTYKLYFDLLIVKIPYNDKIMRKDDILDALRDKGIENDKVLNLKWIKDGIIQAAITDLYHKKGYAFVGVTGGFDPDKNVLNIQIIEGKLEELKIAGLETVPASEAEKLIKLTKNEPMKLAPVQEAFQKIGRSVYFLSVDPNKDIQVNPGSAQDKVKITWTVRERKILDKPEALQKIAFSGYTLYSADLLNAKLGKLPSEPIDNYKLLQILKGIYDTYRKDGYLMADFYNEGLENGTLKLKIIEGQIGKIEIKNPCPGPQTVFQIPEGSQKPLIDLQKQCTSLEVIRKELRIKEGQILNENPLRDSYRNLLQLGYFKEGGVNIAPKLESLQSGIVDITVDVLEEDKLGSLNGAISYNADAGIVGQIKLGWKNVLGTGQDITFEFDRGVIGKPTTNYKIEYNTHTFPFFKDYNFLSFSVFRETKKEDENQPSQHNLVRTGLEFGVGYPLDAFLKLPISLTLQYRYEYDEKFFPPIDNKPSSLDSKELISSVTLQLDHDYRNNPIFPTRGGYERFGIEQAGGFSVGTKFTKLTSQIVFHWQTFEDQTIAVRLLAEAGWDLPSQERFILGSVITVRNWDAHFTDMLGILNVEYRARVTDMAVGILFFDAGIGRDVALLRSFGVEGQIDTPVLGKVRLIISMKIEENKPLWPQTPLFQFGLGTMF